MVHRAVPSRVFVGVAGAPEGRVYFVLEGCHEEDNYRKSKRWTEESGEVRERSGTDIVAGRMYGEARK